MSDIVDYLIIGQGLAGSLLAWELAQRQQSIIIIDNHHHQSSSMVASGLINPVTGQRLHAADNVQTLVSTAFSSYRELESHLSVKLLHPLPMLRLAKSEKDKTLWQRRRQQALYHKFIGDWRERDLPASLYHPFGGFEQFQCARLDIPALLEAIKNEFVQRQCYRDTKLCYEDIRIGEDSIRLFDLRAATVIFCEGHLGRHNPWFDADMWNISRGDILHFHTTELHPMIIHFGCNYVPVGNHEFHWGSSFDPLKQHAIPTKRAHKQLMDSLRDIDSQANLHQLIAQYSGLRPATRDKQPVMGKHPEIQNIAIFNGFGAKASLMAPFYAKHFAEHLLSNQDLASNVRYSRFLSR